MQADLFRKSAVLIEPNFVEAELYKDVLSANGFDVYIAKSPMDALVKLREKEHDLLLLNMETAGQSFFEKFLQNIRREKACAMTAIVGLSIYRPEDRKAPPKELDICLTKPCPIDVLVNTVFDCIEKRVHYGEYEENERIA